MPLTDQEKVKIRHHCGYLNVAEAYTFVLGTPASVETQFMIEGAMNRVLEVALPEVRRQLSILDQIETQMVCSLENLQVQSLGEMTLNTTGPDREMKQLVQQYDYWVDALCNMLGTYRNPFDKRRKNSAGSLNVRVAN